MYAESVMLYWTLLRMGNELDSSSVDGMEGCVFYVRFIRVEVNDKALPVGGRVFRDNVLTISRIMPLIVRYFICFWSAIPVTNVPHYCRRLAFLKRLCRLVNSPSTQLHLNAPTYIEIYVLFVGMKR